MKYLKIICILSYIITQLKFSKSDGILYPKESETREVKSLDGIWAFCLDEQNQNGTSRGFSEKWYLSPLSSQRDVIMMPVPSSYNDITQSKKIRDHIGWVWYETSFWAPERWRNDNNNVFIRFGSANYYAVVWLNGKHILNHTTGGHLPFKADISKNIMYGKLNILVVALNNTLSSVTIPQGSLHQPVDRSRYPKDYVSQSYNFDYFHFAGIHRPVYLYTTPRVYIDDITAVTDFYNDSKGLIGVVKYKIDFTDSGNEILREAPSCTIVVRDKSDKKIGSSNNCTGEILIQNVQLWWPYLSGPPQEPTAYLYTLETILYSGKIQDIYRLKFGVRTVRSTNESFLVNGLPFYFRGFGRHEDYNLRGRGVDMVHLVKDHNLILWSGANSYRTSHYPYAEEILDLTDKLGIVVIDESPAIGLSGFGSELEKNHKEVMRELVQRDKNRASVLMWSIGNEPKSNEFSNSSSYFERLISYTNEIDPGKRPITIVLSEGFQKDQGPKGLDVISINRYFAWYGDTGRTEVISLQIPTEINSWYQKYSKPVLITEYGAGTVAGMHMSPSFVWTEDFQTDYHMEHFKAFDSLRKSTPYFIGEMIWNFADFATPEETFRPWGCMKGIFTRERQPKRVAHIVRWRYWSLANETMGYCFPEDLNTQYLYSYKKN